MDWATDKTGRIMSKFRPVGHDIFGSGGDDWLAEHAPTSVIHNLAAEPLNLRYTAVLCRLLVNSTSTCYDQCCVTSFD